MGPQNHANNTSSSAEVVFGASSSLLSGTLLIGPFSELPGLWNTQRLEGRCAATAPFSIYSRKAQVSCGLGARTVVVADGEGAAGGPPLVMVE